MNLTDYQKLFLLQAEAAAKVAKHVFPAMAACEAALESHYGRSRLCRQYNNLFATKDRKHALYGTCHLPEGEFESKEWWKVPEAEWIVYPSWNECFQDRMATLIRLAPHLPNYAKALAAKEGTEYLNAVSASWATDPKRAASCLAIFDAMAGEWPL